MDIMTPIKKPCLTVTQEKSAQGQRGRENGIAEDIPFGLKILTHVERNGEKKIEPLELATEVGHGLESVCRELSDSRIAGWRGFKSIFLASSHVFPTTAPRLSSLPGWS